MSLRFENFQHFSKYSISSEKICSKIAKKNDFLIDREKLQKNAYFDANIGFDTAENEPSKVRGFLMGVWGVIGTSPPTRRIGLQKIETDSKVRKLSFRKR